MYRVDQDYPLNATLYPITFSAYNSLPYVRHLTYESLLELPTYAIVRMSARFGYVQRTIECVEVHKRPMVAVAIAEWLNVQNEILRLSGKTWLLDEYEVWEITPDDWGTRNA